MKHSRLTPESTTKISKCTHIHTCIHPYIDNFIGVQASGVIIVCCDSAVSYGPKL